MLHVRTQVRNAITAALKTLTTVPSDSIFESRVYKLDSGDLPAIVVNSEREDIETKGRGDGQPGRQTRDIQNTVIIALVNTDEIEDALDVISLEVEDKIFEDHTLGGVAVSTHLISMERFLTEETDKPFGLMKLTFISRVITIEKDAATVI